MKKYSLPALFLSATMPLLTMVPRASAQQGLAAFSRATDNADKESLPGERFWKDKETGMTIRTWKCQETHICGYVYDIDPANPKMRALISNILSDKSAMDYALRRPNKFPEKDVTAEHMRRMCGFGTEIGSEGGLKLFNTKSEKGVITGQSNAALDILRNKGKKYGSMIFDFFMQDKGMTMETVVWPNLGGGPFAWVSKKKLDQHRTLIAIPAPETPACVAPALTLINQ